MTPEEAEKFKKKEAKAAEKAAKKEKDRRAAKMLKTAADAQVALAKIKALAHGSGPSLPLPEDDCESISSTSSNNSNSSSEESDDNGALEFTVDRRAELAKVFRAFDIDGGGFIEATELYCLGQSRVELGKMGSMTGLMSSAWTHERNERMIAEMDGGVNGRHPYRHLHHPHPHHHHHHPPHHHHHHHQTTNVADGRQAPPLVLCCALPQMYNAVRRPALACTIWLSNACMHTILH